MKKYLIYSIIALGLYLLGLFSYALAKPSDIVLNNASTTLSIKASSSVVDLSMRQDVNSLVSGEVLPGSNLYNLKIFGEKLRMYLSKTEKEREKLRVIFLNRRLAEAEVLLESGRSGQAQQMVNQFAKGSAELMAELKKQDFLRTDPAHATEIEKALADQIDLQKSLMLKVASSSPLYPIKARLLELELEMADTPTAKKAILEEQARDKLVKVITSSTTKPVIIPSDWQITKRELNHLNDQVKFYAANSISRIKNILNSVKNRSLDQISKFKK